MIIKLVLTFFITCVTYIFSLITSLLPSSNIDYVSLVSGVLSLCSQGVNFTHFMFGDYFYGFYITLTFFLPFRLIVVPIVSLLRGFIKFGSS